MTSGPGTRGDTGTSHGAVASRGSAVTDDGAERAHAELLEHLRALIRFRTVNPPGDEILAARYVRGVLEDAGLAPELLEPFPGRGDVVVRLRGDGTGGGPLLLLGHLDVVPVEEARWTHDPFGAEIHDGYLYGRGALDMKATVATQLQVVLQLARAARAAGRDPATDPVPGLHRDVILALTADEEAGGFLGAGWLVDNRPELLRADAALTESGGVSMELYGRRFYPIQVAEKGFQVYRIVVRGTPGHASMPRDDNAVVVAARIIDRLAVAGAPRVTPVMEEAILQVSRAVPESVSHRIHHLLHPSARVSDAAADAICEEPYRRAIRSLLRDTVSPDVVHAGMKYNVIPGQAEIEVDCRLLPGTSAQAMTDELRSRMGEELWAACEVIPTRYGAPVEQPLDGEMFPLLGRVLVDADPDAIPIPVMAPYATDAKHLVRLGVPTYGFAPLRLRPGDRFLELFHGDDERVPVDGLRFGLEALSDAVRRYCGS
jgi:acetylornithine deacetylase/succinyl-diaminopimelate desuccinylase-like protein